MSLTLNKKDSVSISSTINQSDPQDRLVEIMLEYAKHCFRTKDTTGRDAVKYTKKPISEPLLPHSDTRLDQLAKQAFHVILSYMGVAHCKEGSELGLIHKLLEICEEGAEMEEEIYCQILKQMTYTTSTKRDALFRAWHLLYIMTMYHLCSIPLQMTMELYLRAVGKYGGPVMGSLAKACYQQLKRLSKVGRRALYPSLMELKALMAGRSRWQIFVAIPGSPVHSVVKINMATTFEDVIQKMCTKIGVTGKKEMQEYGISCGQIQDGAQKPVHPSVYVLDVLQEMEVKSGPALLYFFRIYWKVPLQFENRLRIDMEYQQVMQMYRRGQLLMRKEHNPVTQAEFVAALSAMQHIATGATYTPNRFEVKKSIPADVWTMYDEDYWMNQVISLLEELLARGSTPLTAKIQFLEETSSLSLFGSSLLEVTNQAKATKIWGKSPNQERSNTNTQVDWATLPDQILVKIYSVLNFQDKYCMLLTCKSWSQVFCSAKMWESVAIRARPGENKKWISALTHYGQLIKSLSITVDVDNSHSLMLASTLIDYIAHFKECHLEKIILAANDNDLGIYFKDLQKSLRGLFAATPLHFSGLTVVDFSYIAGQFDDTIFLCLAKNHPNLERLLIANRYPGIQLKPKALLSILKSCKRLSHLAVWNVSLSDEVAEGFLECLRAPLQFLEIHCLKPTSESGIISSNMWKKLKDRHSSLEVHLHFPVNIPTDSIMEITQENIPVTLMEIFSISDLNDIMKLVSVNYRHSLRHLIVEVSDASRVMNSIKPVLQSFTNLQEVLFNEVSVL